MKEKTDIEKAIEGYKRGKDNGDLTTWFSCNEKLFVECLEKCKREEVETDTDVIEALIIREWHLNKDLEGATFGSIAKSTAKVIADYFNPKSDEEA